MNERTRWTRFGVLMTGIVMLLVFGLAPVSADAKKPDSVEEVETVAAEKVAKIETRVAKRGAHIEKWVAKRVKRNPERAGQIKAWAAERITRIEERATKKIEKMEAWVAKWTAKLAPQEEEPAAKPVAGARLRGTTSGMIGPEGGKLSVEYRGGRGGKDNVRVMFIVPGHALDAPVEISMALDLDPEDLSNLRVVFGPSGLKFAKPAKLMIKLGKEVAAELGYQSMVGLHQSGTPGSDGELVEVVPLTIQPGRRTVEVLLEVPGFSRYSIGGGDI